ncbi:FtsW/RodA/SpoVE family cell cycle protein [Qipengyuania sediminis]|uniref:FtsW/RodA/SpoVE family cell cycle protein n=1 Tax=Qipengyuania sediminis TaxID=1532023 RepID=UPI001059D981|nr:putative peptidoglycan glycosyltransferase FtsW [Qipengyuania sediminis]
MTAPRPYIPRAGKRAPLPGRPKSRIAELRVWWREVDRVLLFLILGLMACGSIAVAAASAASADRLSTATETLPPLYFFTRHLAWQFVGLIVMLGVSMLTREQARRLAVVIAIVMLGGMFLVPLIGHEINGARRWLKLGMTLQPSEFLKPTCALAMAWILSWRLRDPSIPVVALTGILLGLIVMLLMLQPNLGDAILFAGFWFVLILLAGAPMKGLGMLAGSGALLLTATYFLYDNARHRIDSFFGGGVAFDQVDLASRTLSAGGWLGAGYGLGIRKMTLPEAHTDYIFSVIGEEFGLVVCALVVLAYLAIVARVLMKLIDEDDLFALLGGAGLIALLGGQAFINILVNLQLFPSKGMTLPLVSYGGSSTIAVCLTVGLLLAVTRRNPHLKRETRGLADFIGWSEKRASGEVLLKREIHP